MIKRIAWLLLALPALALGQASPGGNAYVPGPTIHGTPVTGNCVEWYNATTLEDAGAACGAGAGSVTSVSVVTANGYSGTVATATTTPAITISGPSIPVSANPSATVGLSAVNGTAATFMTSDSAPPLSQAITPTWTGLHKFTNGDLSVLGTSTGYTQLESANASATNYIATFPAASGTVAFTGAAVACSQLPALTGNVTTSAGACSTTIGASQVTLSMQANFAVSSLQGNPTGSPAAPSAITLGSGLAFSGTTLTATGGSGTVTNTGGSLTANSVVLGAGTNDTKVVAGIVTDGTSKLTLGVAGTSVGAVAFNNATSGAVTVSPPTGALGAIAVTWPNASSTLPIFGQQITFTGPTAPRSIALPDAAFTVARTDAGQTFTGTQAFGAITYTTLNGNTWAVGTGTLSIAAGKTLTASNSITFAGTDTTTMTFPATSQTIAGLSTAQTWSALQKYTNADFSLLGSSTGYTLLESGLSGSSNNTLTLPTTATDTIAAIGTAETWTAVQTFTNSDVRLLGSSTGYTTFTSGNSSATNYTLTFPAITDTIVTLTGTQSLTNTFITPRIQSVATATSITPTVGSADFVEQPNTQTAGTLTINAPTGTVVDGQVLTFRINSTAVQTFSWNSAYAAVGGNALPTGTTGGGVTDYFAFRYNSTSSKYEFLARTGGTSSANPSASIGLSAVNGTAGTFMTSDSAPALSQAIVPTWTGLHTFTGGIAATGVTTNSSAAAGYIGEYWDANCPVVTSGASIAFTNATPTVGTYSSPPWANSTAPYGSYACPFYISATAPTGLSTNTTYWAVPINSTTFHVSTTAANAMAGTFANTTGSTTTSTVVSSTYQVATTTVVAVGAMNLTAGDWDCNMTGVFIPTSTTSVSLLQYGINTSGTAQSTTVGQYGQEDLAANVIDTTTTGNPNKGAGPIRVSLASTTAEYAVANATFTASTMNEAGDFRCRRVR